MPKTTDLHAIKTIAKTFVYLDFEMTKFSPVIIHHPYTDSSFVAFQSDGKVQMINLLEDQAGLAKWQKFLLKEIDADKTPWDIYSKITKPYALAFLQMTEKHLSPEDLGQILRDAWMKIEFVSNNPIFSPAQFSKLFQKCDSKSLMIAEERKVLDALPDEIEIYRGVRKGSKKAKGMSWTTDKTVAEWFSKRFSKGHDTGDIYKAVIRKSDVLAFFQGRNEQEIVVKTTGLRHLEKISCRMADVSTHSHKPSLDTLVQTAAAQKSDNTQTPQISKEEVRSHERT